MVLDKNPKQNLDKGLEQIQKEFSNKNPNIVCCSKPFTKLEFLKRLVNSMKIPVNFLDFDLLYSGYVKSGYVEKNENVKIFMASKNNLKKSLGEIIEQISKERQVVILDSFNGFYNIFDELESLRLINAIIMLLSTVAKETKSLIVVTAIGIKNEDGDWFLSPTGRHLINYRNSGMYYIGNSEKGLVLDQIELEYSC